MSEQKFPTEKNVEKLNIAKREKCQKGEMSKRKLTERKKRCKTHGVCCTVIN